MELQPPFVAQALMRPVPDVPGQNLTQLLSANDQHVVRGAARYKRPHEGVRRSGRLAP